MKTEVRNEFILEAHKSACSEWKLKIEKECPELFKSKLEVGKWYINTDKGFEKHISFCEKVDDRYPYLKDGEFFGYGFSSSGNWCKSMDTNGSNLWKLATEEEVKEALIKEAKKRGFKDGCSYITLGDSENYCTYKEIKEYEFENNKLCILGNHKYIDEEFIEKMHCGYIFKDGQWAEIISNPIEEKINDLQKQLDELKKQL